MVFAAVGALAFALLVGGLAWVRLYDDQLIRQTEGELIAQAIIVAEMFVSGLHGGGSAGPTSTGDPAPILPALRASSPVLPRPDDPPASTVPPDPEARKAGEALNATLQRVRRSTLSAIRVLDTQGVLVASSNAQIGSTYADREEVQRALHGEPNAVLRRRRRDSSDAPLASISRDAGVRVWVAIPVVDSGKVRGAILVARTPMTLAKVFYADRWNLVSTLLVLVCVLLLVSVAAAALIVRPIRALVRQANAIAGGAQGEPISAPVVDELAQLSVALSTMASELRARNDYIRSFAASVSHEFKTPLASIQGAIELVRDPGMSPAQRDKFLLNIDADARRLTELVRRLLELARADAAERSAEHSDAGTVLRDLVARASAEGIDVELVAQDARVSLPAGVLDSVVMQLVYNARQHGGPSVRIRVSSEALDGVARIVVRDDGAGISEANRARIFAPFFTTARDRGGTGLGLTIARSLLRPFGATLELMAGGERGTAFVITAQRK
jgi:signal transduction histidine kinase